MTRESFNDAGTGDFTGAKLALLSGDMLISILRDDDPGIPFPACWDFPGGGREGDETPEDCVLRETREELSLTLDPGALTWRRDFPSTSREGAAAWFFVAEISSEQIGRIRLGNEGQRWRQMGIRSFLRLSDAVPYLQDRLRVYLEDIGHELAHTPRRTRG